MMKLNKYLYKLNSFVLFNEYYYIFSRLEHQQMHEKHKGHDAMHAEMIIILFVTLIVAQVALVEWKKRHYRSYSVCFVNELFIIIHF